MKSLPDFFIEINHAQRFKEKQVVCGDTFISKRLSHKNRFLNVLSDGLGSGIKANVLSTLTASMALTYSAQGKDLAVAAQTIMRTLPVDALRKISYATFTIVDIDYWGNCNIVNYDNPPCILIRNGKTVPLAQRIVRDHLDASRQYQLEFCTVKLEEGDKLVVFSDGVTQSGIGSPRFPFGWEQSGVEDFLQFVLSRQPDVSARSLAAQVVEHAFANCCYKATDDITCAVINVRKPRRLLVTTGPSVDRKNDAVMAERINHFPGKTALCGGTTATIIARELQRKVTVDISSLDPIVPCTSSMEGIQLVTEGMITLAKVIELLELGLPYQHMKIPNGATKLIELFQESDIIDFLVGTKINEVHQDPLMPLELGIRRNTIKRLAGLLDEKLLKEVHIEYI